MQLNQCTSGGLKCRVLQGATPSPAAGQTDSAVAPGSDGRATGDEPWIKDLVRAKVARFRSRARLSRSDVIEVRTDLGTHIKLRLEKYSVAKGAVTTYVDRIATRWLISHLIRHRLAAKRDPRREEFSFNEQVRDSSGRWVERHEITLEASVDDQRIHDLRRDLETLRARLPSDQHRHFFDAKARGGTTHSIAIELDVCRPRVEVIEREVRAVALEIGLDGYLER